MFELRILAASDRSNGKRYRDACEWRLDGEPYGGLGDQVLVASDPSEALAPIVFSALDAGSFTPPHLILRLSSLSSSSLSAM